MVNYVATTHPMGQKRCRSGDACRIFRICKTESPFARANGLSCIITAKILTFIKKVLDKTKDSTYNHYKPSKIL